MQKGEHEDRAGVDMLLRLEFTQSMILRVGGWGFIAKFDRSTFVMHLPH